MSHGTDDQHRPPENDVQEEELGLMKLLCRNCEELVLIDHVEQHANVCSIMLPTNHLEKKSGVNHKKTTHQHHIISKLSDLPSSARAVLVKSGLDDELCAAHLEVLCTVLNFTTKLRFCYEVPESPLHTCSLMLQSSLCAPYSLDRNVSHVERCIEECARALAEAPRTEAQRAARAAAGETDARYREARQQEKQRITLQQESLFGEAMAKCDVKTKREVSSMYSVGDEIGKGGFGVVFSADTKKRTILPRRCAIKKMVHSETDMRTKRSNLRELFYLTQLNHPNVVQFVRCHYVANKELWLVLEYLEGGSLRRASELSVFDEKEVAYVARELLQALAYIHSLGLVHRDIKSHNVMLSVEGHVKLIDFGLVADVRRGISTMRGILGTAFWIPPEMVQGKSHSFPADIWSSAICLLELCNGNPPNHKSKIRALFLIGAGYAPTLEKPSWSPNCHKFFDRMLQIEAGERATAAELLQEPYLKTAAPISAMATRLIGLFQMQALAQFL